MMNGYLFSAGAIFIFIWPLFSQVGPSEIEDSSSTIKRETKEELEPIKLRQTVWIWEFSLEP